MVNTATALPGGDEQRVGVSRVDAVSSDSLTTLAPGECSSASPTKCSRAADSCRDTHIVNGLQWNSRTSEVRRQPVEGGSRCTLGGWRGRGGRRTPPEVARLPQRRSGAKGASTNASKKGSAALEVGAAKNIGAMPSEPHEGVERELRRHREAMAAKTKVV